MCDYCKPSCSLDGGLGCGCPCHRVAELERQLKQCDERRQAAVLMHDRVQGRLLAFMSKVRLALAHLGTARSAAKWVDNHFGRTEPDLRQHDKGHAEISVEELSKGIDMLIDATKTSAS